MSELTFVRPGEPVVVIDTAGLWAASRELLLLALDDINRHVVKEPEDAPYYWTVVLSCGTRRIYRTRNDVPANSEGCFCRAVSFRHYFVRYGGDKE